MDRKLVSFACVLAAGCTFNGKPLFGLGGPRPAASPTAAPPAGDGAIAMPQVAAGPAPSSFSWCGGVEPRDEDSVANALQTALPEQALASIASTLCHPDDKARSQRDAIEARRQGWMKLLGMTEQDWASDVVPWSNIRHTDRISLEVAPPKATAWSKHDALDQYAVLSRRTAFGEAFHIQPGGKRYLADAFALTEVGRIGYLASCFEDDSPVAWAVCQPDLDELDAGKLGAELRASKRSAEDKMVVRVAFAELLAKRAQHDARVKALLAKDEGYGKLFELARTARRDWNARRGARAELLALVGSLDDARATGSRKAAAGCSERAWPAFARTVAALGAKRFENLAGDRERARAFVDNAVGVVMRDPDAYLAANALASCEGARDPITGALLRAVETWPGYRGPRTAAMSAIWLAGIELDERGARLDLPHSKLKLGLGDVAPLALDGHAVGVVDSVSEAGDRVRVAFTKSSELRDRCAHYVKTNRISRISDSGEVFYEEHCTRLIVRRVDTTPKPIELDKRYAAGVERGVYVRAYGGIAEGVWSKPDAPTPIAVFGVAVK